VRVVLADVVVEVFQPRTVEFADLLKAFLEFKQLELRQVLVEILGNGATSGLEDGVPIGAIVVARQRDFIHDEGILHPYYNY
jgi:hypothetical protein